MSQPLHDYKFIMRRIRFRNDLNSFCSQSIQVFKNTHLPKGQGPLVLKCVDLPLNYSLNCEVEKSLVLSIGFYLFKYALSPLQSIDHHHHFSLMEHRTEE